MVKPAINSISTRAMLHVEGALCSSQSYWQANEIKLWLVCDFISFFGMAISASFSKLAPSSSRVILALNLLGRLQELSSFSLLLETRPLDRVTEPAIRAELAPPVPDIKLAIPRVNPKRVVRFRSPIVEIPVFLFARPVSRLPQGHIPHTLHERRFHGRADGGRRRGKERRRLLIRVGPRRPVPLEEVEGGGKDFGLALESCHLSSPVQKNKTQSERAKANVLLLTSARAW